MPPSCSPLTATIAADSGEAQRPAGDAKVWICMSDKAYAYHCDRDCRGLVRCNSRKKQVTISEARRLGKGKPCRICHGK